MSFLRNYSLGQIAGSASTAGFVAPLNAENHYATQLMCTCSEFFELGCNLKKHKDILTDEIIYDVAETALFSALDLACLLSPKDPQEFNLHQARIRLFETTWNDLCARREAFLFKTEMPKEAESKQQGLKRSAPRAALSLDDMVTNLYSTAYDFYCLGQSLAKHPDIFKYDLSTHVRRAYSQALSNMALLERGSRQFSDYHTRLQWYLTAEKKLNDNYVQYFLVEEHSASSSSSSGSIAMRL